MTAKTNHELESEIMDIVSGGGEVTRSASPSGLGSHRRSPRRGLDLTGELAREMPRFEFIAHWLAVVTRKKENRGPLGLHVRRRGKRWQVVSPVGGGTIAYETSDPALLFDYVRRTQLGTHVRDAEDFRGLAFSERKMT